MSDKNEMKQQIKDLKKQSSFQSTHNRLSAVRDLVNSTIEDMNRKLDQFQEIQSSWQKEEFYFDSLCSLSNVTDVESIYQSISVPKWSILIGDKSSQLSSPTSLAIQQDTDNVFVSDKRGKRIQVYSSLGEHIRLIEKFDIPLNVFHVDKVFIVGMDAYNREYTELNLESLVSRTIKSKREVYGYYHTDDDWVNRYTSVSSYLNSSNYVFFFASRSGYCNYGIKIHKFIDTKPIINPPNKNQPIYPINISESVSYSSTNFRPVSIATDGIHVYLLLSNSDNLIYEFDSEDCKFIRSFCSSSLLSSPKCVCVDSRGNILVAGSEGDTTKLLYLSPDGDVIHELLLPYEECIGIAVNSKFDVAILCNGNTHGLIAI